MEPDHRLPDLLILLLKKTELHLSVQLDIPDCRLMKRAVLKLTKIPGYWMPKACTYFPVSSICMLIPEVELRVLFRNTFTSFGLPMVLHTSENPAPLMEWTGRCAIKS